MIKDNLKDLFPPEALDGVLPARSTNASRHADIETALSTAGSGTANERHIYRVSELLSGIRDTLDMEFGPVWIEGEISGFSKAVSGHCYFTLREGANCLKCVMFKGAATTLDFSLEDGLHIQLHGNLNIYANRGDLQLIADRVEKAGEGLLFAELERLKKRLEAEGLFDSSLKKALPEFPETVFLITSPAGAAARDFIRTARNRFPGMHIILVPTLVQGTSAASEIAAALQRADNAAQEDDIIVVTRGGGSLEDLWAFNEETTVRQIAACTTPVVSAIGHETDFTLTDYAADLRTATPTAAATAAIPDAEKLRDIISLLIHRAARGTDITITKEKHRLQVLRQQLRDPRSRLTEQRQLLDEIVLRLEHNAGTAISRKKEKITFISGRLRLNSPAARIETSAVHLKALKDRLSSGLKYSLHDKRSDLKEAAARLNGISPLSVLARGYSIVFQEQPPGIINDAAQVHAGDHLVIRPHSGEIHCKVLETRCTVEDSADIIGCKPQTGKDINNP